jgi:hypothetical protein
MVLLLTTQPLWGQGDDGDCRLDPNTLEPLVLRFNPYFADHKWDQTAQMEMGRLDAHRLLVITQEGCKRHHTKFTLMVDPEVAKNYYPFWVEEITSMMEKVYWERAEYERFRVEFEQVFEEKFLYHGFNTPFNFPIGSRNFICSVYFHPERGGRISIEMVRFIFKEEIESRSRQIAPEEDDGWLGHEERP